jgi:hypothetical protein
MTPPAWQEQLPSNAWSLVGLAHTMDATFRLTGATWIRNSGASST